MVTQFGNVLSVEFDQSGNNNRIDVTQNSMFNKASIYQLTDDNVANITQNGFSNTAVVHQ